MNKPPPSKNELFQRAIKRFCKATTHANAARMLEVPVWTMRNWLYGRNCPSPTFQKYIMATIKEIISRARYC
jgi:hypothetical protein